MVLMRKDFLRNWGAAFIGIPRLTWTALRFGVLPSPQRYLNVAREEGLSWNLPLKVFGDSTVKVFQESGPLFIKFGQILSTRDDLLPQVLCERLETLTRKQKAMPLAEREKVLAAAFQDGSPFVSIEHIPLGVGSIGEVYRAKLRNGEAVVVKILRPGIAAQIERDFQTLRTLVKTLFAMPRLKIKSYEFLIEQAITDLYEGIKTEANLLNEAQALMEFEKRFRESPHIKIPKCYWELSSPNVLVMEELKGKALADFREDEGQDYYSKRMANLALREILRQIFEDGRFHADPHGGNLLVLEDGRLGLIDLGLTGTFQDKDRKQIARALRAIAFKDADALVQAMLSFGIRPLDFNEAAFKEDILSLVRSYRESALKSGGEAQERLDLFVGQVFAKVREHRIHIPTSTTLLIKTLVTIEGLSKSLDPEIDIVKTALPIVLAAVAPRWLRWLPFERVSNLVISRRKGAN
jgi:ubiquinone biosynthesis protein